MPLTLRQLPQSPYQVAYQEIGSGLPILFIHGFFGQSDDWRSLLPYFQDHYRCLCIDLLGFGQSSKPMMRYDIACFVEFVDQTLDLLGIESCILVGHSLGGWVSAAYAIQYPDRVHRLILAAPAGIRDDSFCGRYDAYRPLFWRSPLIDLLLWIAQPCARLLGKPTDLVRIRQFRHALNTQPAPRSFLLDRLRPEDAIDTVEQEIHRITVPTLVVTGDRDETIPLWHCQTYAQSIPHAQLTVIPNADHGLPQQYAEEMAIAIQTFLPSNHL
jgi:pimeloyl-ACP methyl ester carboxylesterase